MGSVTEIMKNFIDRMLPIFDPRTKKDNDGHYDHLPRYEKYPDMFLISNGVLRIMPILNITAPSLIL